MAAQRREKGEVVIFDLEGEIRLTEDPPTSLHRLVAGELDAGKRDFLLDFQRVDFFDSYAVGELISAHAAVRRQNGRLKLVNLSPKIWMILQYSGLTRVLEVFDSEEKALQSFA